MGIFSKKIGRGVKNAIDRADSLCYTRTIERQERQERQGTERQKMEG